MGNFAKLIFKENVQSFEKRPDEASVYFFQSGWSKKYSGLLHIGATRTPKCEIGNNEPIKISNRKY